jgi:hypothetical protein
VVQTCFIFHLIYGIILPIDALIFFKMVIAPPTRRYKNQVKPASELGLITGFIARMSSPSVGVMRTPSDDFYDPWTMLYLLTKQTTPPVKAVTGSKSIRILYKPNYIYR